MLFLLFGKSAIDRAMADFDPISGGIHEKRKSLKKRHIIKAPQPVN